MKKILLAALFVLIMVICANAGCVTNAPSMMYLSEERMLAFDRMGAINPAEAKRLFLQDLKNGDVVVMPKGTKLDEVNRYNSFISTVIIDGVEMICWNDHVECK